MLLKKVSSPSSLLQATHVCHKPQPCYGEAMPGVVMVVVVVEVVVVIVKPKRKELKRKREKNGDRLTS